MDRLVLIDGNALVHRAYHAYPPFTDSDNNPVGGVYGFFSMLLKILQDMQPHHLVVCFDSEGATFRQQLYVAYHAHRPQLSDDFVPQLIAIQEMLRDAGICTFAVSGYEADDLIGTIAHQTVQKQQEVEVIIVSGDRDLLQLVNSHVRVLMPIVGITNMTIFDEQKVLEKYGVTPQQFIDYKALIGDVSDGYPGVTGIGPKGAANLIAKFGTFENLYKNLGEVPQGVSQKLANDAEQATLAKKLATIVTDAPIHLKFKDTDIKNLKKEVLLKTFRKLGFQSLTKRWEDSSEKNSVQQSTGKKKVSKVSQQLGLLE